MNVLVASITSAVLWSVMFGGTFFLGYRVGIRKIERKVLEKFLSHSCSCNQNEAKAETN